MRYRITKKNTDNFYKQVIKGRDNIKRLATSELTPFSWNYQKLSKEIFY